MGETPLSAEHSGQTLPRSFTSEGLEKRQAPGGNRTAIGPVYKEKGAGLMYRLSGDWGTGNGPRAELSVTL